ncbi:MAG: hypothetical protein AAGA20_19255 [Planctomycetota bacterium]
MPLYSAYGLRCASEFDLPGLVAAESADADVEFSYGSVRAAPTQGSWYRLAPTESALVWEDVGAFSIEAGSRIVVDVPRPASRTVAHAVLGPAMALLLQQRGLTPLHASAVAVDGTATLIAGESGAGKSTLARALLDRGCALVTDDIAAVEVDGSRAQIAPGPASLRLWPEALDRLGVGLDETERLHEETKKRLESIASAPQATTDAIPVRRICILTDGERIALQRIDRVSAAIQILAHIYYPELIGGAVEPQELFGQCAAIASSVETLALERPRGLEHLDGIADLLLGSDPLGPATGD